VKSKFDDTYDEEFDPTNFTREELDIWLTLEPMAATSYYIVDSRGNRMLDSENIPYVAKSRQEIHSILSFYFDMSYDDYFGVVNAENGQALYWITEAEFTK
jgi:hypothetical protein